MQKVRISTAETFRTVRCLRDARGGVFIIPHVLQSVVPSKEFRIKKSRILSHNYDFRDFGSEARSRWKMII